MSSLSRLKRKCLLAAGALVLLLSLATAQQTCYNGSKYPKLFQEPVADEQVETVIAVESISALFAGGQAQDASAARPFVMRIDLTTDQIIWRRFMHHTGSEMNIVTALVHQPDADKLACVGSNGADQGGYTKTWFWIISGVDGSFISNIVQIEHGLVDRGEHYTSSKMLLWGANDSDVFMAQLQTSPTQRNNRGGRVRLLKIHTATLSPSVAADKEYLRYSYAGAIFWTLDDPLSICIGSVIEFQIDDNDVRWRPGFICANNDINVPSSQSGVHYFSDDSQTSTRSQAPLINNVAVETSYVAGERWVFGTTRGLTEASYTTGTNFFKARLKSGSVELESQNMKKINGLTNPAYVVAIREQWDSSGKMHYVLMNGDNSIYYGIYGWTTSSMTLIKLYDDFSWATGVFYGSSMVTVSGIDVYQGYLGGGKRNFATSAGDQSRAFDAATILPFHTTGSCLTAATGTITLSGTDRTNNVSENSNNNWSDYSLTPYGTTDHSAQIWDAPISSLADDSWCSSFIEPITSVTGGAVEGLCLDLGSTGTTSFTPPIATATSACTDTDLPWAYQVEAAGADLDLVKIVVDPQASQVKIYFDSSLSGPINVAITLHAGLPTGQQTSMSFNVATPSACPLIAPSVFLNQLYYVYQPLTGYEFPDFSYTASCPTVPITYSNSVITNGGNWITDNGGSGRFVQWYTNDPAHVKLYTIQITASSTCGATSQTYTLDVIENNCLDPDSVGPATTLTMQEYTITALAQNYVFDMFVGDPSDCPFTAVYTYSDDTGSTIVQSLDSNTRTFTFYYDSDIALSGGPAIEFTDYTVTIHATMGITSFMSTTGTFTLRVKNPCFDPNFVSIVPTPLPAGDYQYMLFDYSEEDPYWIITHDPWSYSTTPITHTFCGDITYTATYEGALVDETTLPDMSYWATNRTFGIFSMNFNLVGLNTVVSVSAHLVDYPMIVNDPIGAQTEEILILDPCLSPVSVDTPAQQNSAPYNYTGNFPPHVFNLKPFKSNPNGCAFVYSCTLLSGPIATADLCAVNDGTTQGVFNPVNGQFTFQTQDIINYPPGTYSFQTTGTVGDKSDVAFWQMVLVDPCPNASFFLKQNPFPDVTYYLRDPQVDLSWVLDDLVNVFTLVDCGAISVTFFNDDATNTPIDATLFSDFRDPTQNQFQVLSTQDVTVDGVYSLTYQVQFDDYPSLVQMQTVPFTITIVDPCDAPVSVTPPVALVNQEYTITQTVFDYIFDAYTADPNWCTIVYSYSVNDPNVNDVITFDGLTRTFSFFEPSNISLAGADFIDYTITITGTSGNVTPTTGSKTFNLRVKNPCIDTAYVQIVETALTSQTYQLYDLAPSGLQWTHDPFTLTPDPSAAILCGEFTYVATFNNQAIDATSAPMSYDTATRSFTFYSEDFNLVGSHVFTIEAFLTNHPAMATATKSQSTTLTVLDPCPNPISVMANPSQMTLPAYLYTGLTNQVDFSLNPFFVNPTTCPFQYQCQLTSGPRMDVDLCTVNDSSTQGSFSESTGRFTFRSVDMANYPVGTYTIRITGIVGNKQDFIEFDMILEDPCFQAEITLLQSPFVSKTYSLRDPELGQIWDESALLFADTLVDCGAIIVEIYNDDASKTTLDPIIFRDDRDPSTNNELVVNYSEDVSIKGSYPIKFKAYFAGYSLNFVESPNPFIITIVDPCDAPTLVTPSALTDQEYTITQTSFDYIFDMFIASPTWCNVDYSYSVIDTSVNDVITFDGTTRTFSFFEPGNLLLSDADFTDYTVLVTGTSGNITPTTGTGTFNLRVKNPCIDPNYLQITTEALPTGLSYALYDTQLSITHTAFNIVAVPEVLAICGDLGYTSTFDNAPIDTLTLPMSYESDTRSITMYSEDFSLVGTHSISIKAHLKDYETMVISSEEVTTIEVIDPCLDPFALTIPPQVPSISYSYTGTSPRLSFTPVPAQVTPSVCPINYSCVTLSYPVLPGENLCAINDGATQSTFNMATGRFTFASIDMASYSPGTYEMQITATSGAKSTSFTIDVILVDPCPTIDLSIQASPFVDKTYVLRDPPQTQPWQAANLISPATQVDCGPISVEFFRDDLSKSPIEAALFLDDRSADPFNQFQTLYADDVALKGSYPMRYEVYHSSYPTNRVEQTQAFIITVVDACNNPNQLLAQPLANQEYITTTGAFTYQAPAFIKDPVFCDIIYSVEVSDPLAQTYFSFDADPATRQFTFFNDQDVFPAGVVSTDYTVTLKGQLGTLAVIETTATFTLTLKNPCYDPAFVLIGPVALPTGLDYALFDYSASDPYQFFHDPFTVTTQPVNGHSLCGEVDYLILFDGVTIDAASTPVAYNTNLRAFSVYSEDYAYIGVHEIAVQGYFRDWPDVRTAEPHLTTTIEFIDPCTRPASITVPQQTNPAPYLYTQGGVNVIVNPLVVDPPMCAVTYECVSITGIDPDVQCSDKSVISFNPQTGRLNFKSTQMEKYSPGVYEITYRATAGTEVPIFTDFTMQLRLQDPCPTATLTNLQAEPFEDVNYILGNEEISQQYTVSELVSLSTKVDCGPIELEFVDDDGEELETSIFAITQQADGLTNSFTVLEQALAESQGQYKVRYRAYLARYPYVEAFLQQPFTVTVTDEDLPNYSVQPEPEWFSIFNDTIIPPNLDGSTVISLGDTTSQFDEEAQISFDFGYADRFVDYDPQFNNLIIWGQNVTADDDGLWSIEMTVEYADDQGKSRQYTKIMQIGINIDQENGQSMNNTSSGDGSSGSYSSSLRPIKTLSTSDLEKMATRVWTEPQSKQENRPVPYIADFSSRGILTIAWDRQMKPFAEPKKIPDSRIAVDFNVYGDSASNSEKGRRLRQGLREEVLLKDLNDEKARRLMLLDALEVKMIQDIETGEESDVISFEWDLIDFDDDFIWLQIDFENPDKVGTFSSKDYITVTFWGVDFFKSFQDVEVQFGYQLRQRIYRMIQNDQADSLDAVENSVNTVAISIFLPLVLIVGLGGRLLPTWMFLNSLQLIVHTPLLPAHLPANVHYFLTSYLGYLRLNSIEIGQSLESQSKQFDSSDPVSEDTNLATRLLMTGYRDPISRNLVIILCLAVLQSIIIVCLSLYQYITNRMGQRQISRRSKASWMINFTIRYAYEFFLEICLCAFIQMAVANHSNSLKYSHWVVTYAALLLIIAFIVLIVSLFFTRGPYIAGTYERGSLMESVWGKRQLSKTHQKDLAFKSERCESDTARHLLPLASTSAVATPKDDQVQLYEGGQKSSKIEGQTRLKKVKIEAAERFKIAESVQVTAWHATLFYGLKLNHPHNVAIVHPLSFLLRRVLFALLIVSSNEESALFSALLMLLTCVFMLIMVCSEGPWVDPLINKQHFVNEVAFYLICSCLMVFSGVITSTDQAQELGKVVIALVCLVIFYNLGVIVYDMQRQIRLLLARYRVFIQTRARTRAKIQSAKQKKAVLKFQQKEPWAVTGRDTNDQASRILRHTYELKNEILLSSPESEKQEGSASPPRSNQLIRSDQAPRKSPTKKPDPSQTKSELIKIEAPSPDVSQQTDQQQGALQQSAKKRSNSKDVMEFIPNQECFKIGSIEAALSYHFSRQEKAGQTKGESSSESEFIISQCSKNSSLEDAEDSSDEVPDIKQAPPRTNSVRSQGAYQETTPKPHSRMGNNSFTQSAKMMIEKVYHDNSNVSMRSCMTPSMQRTAVAQRNSCQLDPSIKRIEFARSVSVLRPTDRPKVFAPNNFTSKTSTKDDLLSSRDKITLLKQARSSGKKVRKDLFPQQANIPIVSDRRDVYATRKAVQDNVFYERHRTPGASSISSGDQQSHQHQQQADQSTGRFRKEGDDDDAAGGDSVDHNNRSLQQVASRILETTKDMKTWERSLLAAKPNSSRLFPRTTRNRSPAD